jgi:hypothetical protein
VSGLEGQPRQPAVLLPSQLREAAREGWCQAIEYRALVEKTHVERGLRADAHRRVAKGLATKTVALRALGVVIEQVDVITVVGFVGGAGQHREHGHLLPRLQSHEALRGAFGQRHAADGLLRQQVRVRPTPCWRGSGCTKSAKRAWGDSRSARKNAERRSSSPRAGCASKRKAWGRGA